MLSNRAIQNLKTLVDHLENNKHHLIIDGDTHPTKLSTLEDQILRRYQSTLNYYHGRPISHLELLEGMASVGIDMSLIWQNPAAFSYGSDHNYNFKKLLQANMDIADFAQQYPQRFIPAGWTDPKGLGIEIAIELTSICVQEFGFSIVKMNPAQNAFPIDSPDVFKVVEKIIELGATPAFHFGGDSPYTPAKGLEKIVSAFPHHPIIGVHMGGGGSHYVDGDPTHIEARELGLKYRNLFYIMSAKRDCHIKSDLILYTQKGKPFNENLAWGSDTPYGLQSWNFGGLNKLFESLINGKFFIDPKQNGSTPLFTQKIIQNYLGTNLANLIIKSCKSILKIREEKQSII